MTQVPSAPVAPFARPRSKGMAVAALVLGICSIIPALGMLTGLAAIILGIIVLATGRAGKGMAVAGLILGLILPVLGMMTILMPALGAARERARRVACASNLKSLDSMLRMYVAEHNASPPNVDTLIRQYGMAADVLECVSAETPGKPSIFVLFPARTIVDVPNPATTVIACDYRGNHGKRGRNALYLDGHTEFLNEAQFQAKLVDPENAAFAAALRAKEGP